MTRPLRFHPAAQLELDEATRFYDAEDVGLGGAFLDDVERACKQVQAFPESSPFSVAPVRTKILAAFPFTVISWETGDAVIVLALAHHSRRPGYWRGRE